jgi:hypothetical protein
MKICYHGTDEEAARSILVEGFRPDTWFAQHLEDALAYGGPWVFEVVFPDDVQECGWQFHHLQPIPEDRIISLIHFESMVAADYSEWRKQVFESNSTGE